VKGGGSEERPGGQVTDITEAGRLVALHWLKS